MEVEISHNANKTFLTQKGKIKSKRHFNSYREQIPEEEFFDEGVQESTSTLLLKKNQDSVALQDVLTSSRETYFLRVQRCEEREAELEKKRREFQAHVAKFEEFMQKNEQTRATANKKVQEEMKERQEKEEEIILLKQQIELLNMQKKGNETQLSKQIVPPNEMTTNRTISGENRRYERYLDSVVLLDESFENRNDILARFATLEKISNDLKAVIENNEEEIEQLKHTLSHFQKECANEILILEGDVSIKKEEMEKMRQDVSLKEQEVYEGELAAKIKNSEIGEVKLAISNIYSRHRIRWGNTKDLTVKLDRICTQVLVLQDILKDWNAMDQSQRKALLKKQHIARKQAEKKELK